MFPELLSRFPAERDVIVQVEIIEPCSDVFAGFADVADPLREKLERFDVTIGTALIQPRAPLLDFPRRALEWRVLLDPCDDFAVSFAGGEFFFNVSAVMPVKRKKW